MLEVEQHRRMETKMVAGDVEGMVQNRNRERQMVTNSKGRGSEDVEEANGNQ